MVPLVLLWLGCASAPEAVEEVPAPPLKVDHGVDTMSNTVHVGVLLDRSNPDAVAAQRGREALVAAINAGAVSVLDEGWSVALHTEPVTDVASATEAFDDVVPGVLFFASLGSSAHTRALQSGLASVEVVGVPDALDGAFNTQERTPVLGASVQQQAKAAAAWIGSKTDAAPTLVWSDDVQGRLMREALPDLQALPADAPTAVAGMVVLAVTPDKVAPWLEENAPGSVTWVAPTWTVAGSAAARVTGHTWVQLADHVLPGMEEEALAVPKQHLGAAMTPAALRGWWQLHTLLEGAKRAIRQGNATRFGTRMALQNITGFRPGDLTDPLDLQTFPYAVVPEVTPWVPVGATGWAPADPTETP